MGKEDKIKSLTPNKNGRKSSTSSMFTVTNAPKKGNQGKGTGHACDSAAQRRGSKNCSKRAKGKEFSTKGSTKTVGTLQKRKKLQEKADKLKGKLSKSKKGSPTKKHANPRYL